MRWHVNKQLLVQMQEVIIRGTCLDKLFHSNGKVSRGSDEKRKNRASYKRNDFSD